MPNLPNDSQAGSINFWDKPILIGTIQGTSLLKPQPPVTYIAPIARVSNLITTWTFDCLSKLWTRHQAMGQEAFHCICSVSPCYILHFLKESNTYWEGIPDIQYFSPPTELYSIATLMTWFYLESQSASGHGGLRLNLGLRPGPSYDVGEGFAFGL